MDTANPRMLMPGRQKIYKKSIMRDTPPLSFSAPARRRIITPRLYLNKLNVPAQPRDAVVRQRLINKLLECDRNVVALVAPAGYGKTMLMAQCHEAVAASGQPLAWLSLDDRDNDFSRFFIYLREVILKMDLFTLPPDENTASPSDQPFSDLRAEAFDLIDWIAATPTPFTLFMEDFDAIRSPVVVSFIHDLIRSLNPGQRLVISARTGHALPLSSLEMSGQLVRIEPQALLFDLEEAFTFFCNQAQDSLSEKDIALLHRKTDGWAAALRLITLAAPGPAHAAAWIEGLSGGTERVARYLAENVFARLPKELCVFMVQTSILDHLYGNLCDAVLESSGSNAILHDIHKANLFLSLVDAKTPVYKFHSLFRGFLLAELERTDTALIARLHRRAAVFFCSSGHYSDALSHAEQSGDIALMADILELGALRFVELGQVESLAKWLDAVDAASIADRPNVQRARAYAMIALHRYADVHDALEKLRSIAGRQGRDLDPEAATMRALMYEWMDRHDMTATEMDRINSQAISKDSLTYGILQNIKAYLSTIHCEYAQAQEALDAAKASYQNDGYGSWRSTYTLCFEGVLEMIFGNARAAIHRFEMSLSQAMSAGHSSPSAYLADALYVRGELDRAGSLAEEHLRLNRLIAPPDIVILSFRTAARVSFLNGNLDQCEALLTELGDIGDMRDLPRLKASAWLEKSRVALLYGDIASASRFFKLGSDPKIWASHQGAHYYAGELDDPSIAAMRMDLVLGDIELAAANMETALKEATLSGRQLRKIRLQCLLAQAYSRMRKHKQGLELLDEALHAGSKSGLIHVFADEPWCLLELLEELTGKAAGTEAEYRNQVISATRLVAQRIGALLVAKKQSDLLTLKETAIIRLLADGKANKELARILNITENTVETHLRRINQKLDTKNRTQAVTKARELGLLH